MRIVHIIPNLRRGGAERLVIDIVRELAKYKNCIVRLVIFRNEIAYRVDDIMENIKWIPSEVSLSFVKKNTYNIDGLQNFLNDFQPDIIHSHLFESEIVSRSCFCPKAKWFSHCHDNMRQFKKFGLDTLLHKSHLTNFYERMYLFNRYNKNSGNTFIAISTNTFNYFSTNAGKYKTIHLPNAINIERFKRKESELPHEMRKIRLINIGTFDDNKNQGFLIDVAKSIHERFFDFEMHFLGNGNNKKTVEAYAGKLGLMEKIHFHGSVENVEQYLWNADIYVHSAKSEALGLTLIEAMAAGLPVVTLDGGGNADLIQNGSNGFLLSTHTSAKQFADVIISVATNQNLYKQMRINAQKVAEGFDIRDYTRKLLEIYKSSTIPTNSL